MKSLALAFAAVAALSTQARAEVTTTVTGAAVDAHRLATTAMNGPYATAFDEVCADVRDGALRREATCARVRAFRLGAARAEIHRVGWGDGSGDYYLALHTATGWFVSDVPLQIDSEDGHAGHYDVAAIDSIDVAQETLTGGRAALSFQIRQTWTTYCDACSDGERPAQPSGTFATSATLVCSVDGATAACTAPMYTRGELDHDHPPRVVGGKLVARGVELGEPTEYGQEWHDLADGRYTIAL
jgi:hypothetical protein